MFAYASKRENEHKLQKDAGKCLKPGTFLERGGGARHPACPLDLENRALFAFASNFRAPSKLSTNRKFAQKFQVYLSF